MKMHLQRGVKLEKRPSWCNVQIVFSQPNVVTAQTRAKYRERVNFVQIVGVELHLVSRRRR